MGAVAGPARRLAGRMKTRTLLLLSVGTALMILIAGGVLLFQLSNEQDTIEPTALGAATTVGDARVTVFGVVDDPTGGDLYTVDVELGGVDDLDGVDGFSLVTGDRSLAPVSAPADGRCAAIGVRPVRCVVQFDVDAVESTSRVLIMRRGDQQRNWTLSS